MKKRSLKQQLLLSVTALLLCVSMFVGSTFAWFTDSVTSTNNIIKSGTLDVSLEWLEGVKNPTTAADGDWMNAAESDPIFTKDELWEPGYTAVRHIKIENEGSLALKYMLTITAYESGSIVAPEDVSILADVIDVYYADPAQAVTRDTVETLDKLGTLREVLAGLNTTAKGTLLKGENDTVTLALKMREDANNDYQGKSIGQNFSITLYATQLTHESDSFDENYDKDSVYAEHFVTTADELTAAIAEGGVIALMNDLELADNTNIIIPDGVETTINLNGNDIVSTSTETGKNRASFTVKGDLTVEGNGTVSHVHTGANMEWNNLTAPFSVEGGTLTLGEGVTIVNNGGSDMAYAVDVNTTLGASTLNVNGATLYSSYIGVRIFNNHNTEKGTVNFNSGIIQGDKNGYDIWAQLMSCPAENAVVNIADGIDYTTADLSGTMYYIDSKETVVASADSLSAALASTADDPNVEAVLASDVTFTGIASMLDRSGYVEAYGNKVGFAQYGGVIDGNGHEIVDEDGDDSYVIVTHGGTIKNLTITTGARGIVTYSPTEDVYLDNIVVDGPGYALNSTEYGDVDMVVTNSTINGWTSLAGFNSVSFEKCKLGENSAKYWQGFGYDQDYDRLFRVYSPTTFTNCEFEQGYYLDMSAGGTATVKNCTVNGVVINAENYADYITVEIPSGKILSDCVTFA